MKESLEKEVHVQISISEEKAHLILLEAMYKIDTLDNASVDQLLNVLKLSHVYDAMFVFKKCKYCLQVAVVSLDICEQIMRFVKISNTITHVEDLVSTLQSFLLKQFSPLDKTWQTTNFRELSKPSVRYLLSSDQLNVISENTVFHALMYWIEHHGIENVLENEDLPSLLSLVRFELMPIDYLYNIVQHHPVANTLADFNDHYIRGISYHALNDKIREMLPYKSVKRGSHTNINTGYGPISYTWVIPGSKLDELVGTDKEFKSNEFWFCGYRIVIRITQFKQEKSYNFNKHFTAKLSLEIVNLTQHSAVEISWSPESEDQHLSGDYELSHTFKKNAHVSCTHIYYEIKPKIHAPPPKSGSRSTSAKKEKGSPPTGFAFNSKSPPFSFSIIPSLSIDIRMRLR